MKYKKLAELDTAELQKKELELKRELIKLNGSVATGTSPKNPGQLKVTKKTIARIKTALKEREAKVNG